MAFIDSQLEIFDPRVFVTDRDIREYDATVISQLTRRRLLFQLPPDVISDSPMVHKSTVTMTTSGLVFLICLYSILIGFVSDFYIINPFFSVITMMAAVIFYGMGVALSKSAEWGTNVLGFYISLYHSVEHFLPLVFTIIIMWAALILLRDRPGDVLRVIIEEFTKLSKLQIDLKSVNLIGALLIFALIIGFLVESLLHTAFMMAASHSVPENELMANAFTCGLILFFGLYFLICISISKSTK